MITLCPSCHTHFRVHAEQLALRAGQVRCGKCSAVFDALEHLLEELPAARHPPTVQERLATRAPIPAAPLAPQPAPAQEPELDADGQASAIAHSADLEAETVDAATETSAPVIAAAAPAPQVEPAAAPAANAFDFGPLAAARPDAGTRRWPWVLGALLLSLLVIAQAAYYYRSALLVLFPEAKPYAAELCATLGCELPLPRRIELMSIEASDLQADTTNPNIMVLSATLKNRAIFDQQLPLLELTLTDAQDQPVVRRVLAPQDYIGRAAAAQTGFGANSEIAIKVFIEGSRVKATGYRLYLFYA